MASLHHIGLARVTRAASCLTHMQATHLGDIGHQVQHVKLAALYKLPGGLVGPEDAPHLKFVAMKELVNKAIKGQRRVVQHWMDLR